MQSFQVSSNDATPTRSVHKERCMYVCAVEEVVCVSVLQRGHYSEVVCSHERCVGMICGMVNYLL